MCDDINRTPTPEPEEVRIALRARDVNDVPSVGEGILLIYPQLP